MEKVMKYILLILTLLSVPIFGMEPSSKGLGNPYIMAAGIGAISYYAPAFAQAALPENSAIPHIIQYGGYATAAYLASFGYTSPLEVKKNIGKKALTVAKKSLNAAPAVLCHPVVAKAAANACMTFAQPRLSEKAAGLMQSYLPTALMAVGGGTTAYLINRNIVTPKQAYEKTIELANDAKPFSFVLPTIAALKAEAIKNGIMKYLPAMRPELQEKSGSLIKNTIIVAGATGAVYLFATEFLGLATQQYVKRQMDKLVNRMSALAQKFGFTLQQLEYAGENVTALKSLSAEQLGSLLTFSAETNEQLTRLEKIQNNIGNELSITNDQITALNAILKACKPTIKEFKQEVAQAASRMEEIQNGVKQALAEIPGDSDEQTAELNQMIQGHRTFMESFVIALKTIQDDQTSDLVAAKGKLAKIVEDMKSEKTALEGSLTKIAETKEALKRSAQSINKLSGGLVVNPSSESDGDEEDNAQTPGKEGGSK